MTGTIKGFNINGVDHKLEAESVTDSVSGTAKTISTYSALTAGRFTTKRYMWESYSENGAAWHREASQLSLPSATQFYDDKLKVLLACSGFNLDVFNTQGKRISRINLSSTLGGSLMGACPGRLNDTTLVLAARGRFIYLDNNLRVTANIPLPSSSANGYCCNGKLFYYNNSGNVYYYNDTNSEWVSVGTFGNGSLRYNDGLLVYRGNSVLQLSTDGISWTDATTYNTTFAGDPFPTKIGDYWYIFATNGTALKIASDLSVSTITTGLSSVTGAQPITFPRTFGSNIINFAALVGTDLYISDNIEDWSSATVLSDVTYTYYWTFPAYLKELGCGFCGYSGVVGTHIYLLYYDRTLHFSESTEAKKGDKPFTTLAGDALDVEVATALSISTGRFKDTDGVYWTYRKSAVDGKSYATIGGTLDDTAAIQVNNPGPYATVEYTDKTFPTGLHNIYTDFSNKTAVFTPMTVTATYLDMSLFVSSSYEIYSMYAHENTVLAVGKFSNTIATSHYLRSSDGGSTWTEMTTLPNNKGGASVIYFKGAWYVSGTYYSGGNVYYIHKSTDDGLTWSTINTSIWGVLSTDGESLLVSGSDGNSDSIFRSTDGTNFTKVSSISTIRVAAVATDIFVTFDYTTKGFFRSTDGGVTWSSVFSPSIYGSYMNHLYDPVASDGTNVIYYTGNVRHISHDEGLTWTSVEDTSHPPLAYIDSIFVCPSKGVYSLDVFDTTISYADGTLVANADSCCVVSNTVLSIYTGALTKTTVLKDYYTKIEVDTALSGKQGALTAGTGISISQGIITNTGLINTATGTNLTIGGTATTSSIAYGNINIGQGSKITVASIPVQGGIAIGQTSEVRAINAVALGRMTLATGSASLAIGFNARSTAEEAYQIGRGTNANSRTLQVGFWNPDTERDIQYQLLDSSGNIPAARLSNIYEVVQTLPASTTEGKIYFVTGA